MVVVENVWQFPQIKIAFLWKVAIPMSLVKDGNLELIIRQTTPLKNGQTSSIFEKTTCHVQVRITDEKKIDDKDDAFNADLMIETMFVFTIPWKNSSWLY